MEEVQKKLKQLKMKSLSDNLPQVLKMADEKNWPVLKTFEHLLDMELEAKRINKVARLFKESKLNEKNTIDQFEFKYHKSREKQKSLILNLMDLEFIKEKKNIILIGNTGVGKSYLAKCVAYAATQAGIKTLFTTATNMINHLVAAQVDNTLLKKLHYYQSPDLLVCDEIGYLPLGIEGSNLFFQVISERHEKKSTVITTNLPFAKWSDTFGGTTIATVIADRLVSNSEVLILEGNSYRMRKN